MPASARESPAIGISIAAPDAHGLPRNNADKRNAVQMLLDDEEWSAWSDRVIAETCRVSQPFVSSMRPTGDNGYHLKRKGKDGKSYPKARSKRTAPPLANPNGARTR